MHGEYGIEDVAISTLTLVGPNGVQGKVPLKLTDEEVAKLQKSANSLKKQIETSASSAAFFFFDKITMCYRLTKHAGKDEKGHFVNN